MRILILLSMLFSFTTASADSVFDGVFERLGKCYSRDYTKDKNHLKNHPEQTVTHMSAKLFYSVYHNDDGTKVTYPEIKIQAKVRNDKNVYGVEMSCDPKSGHCYIDCDGPSVEVRMSTNNPGSLLVDNSRSDLVLDPLTCGDEDDAKAANLFLKATKGGDDLFRLDPMPDFECL